MMVTLFNWLSHWNVKVECWLKLFLSYYFFGSLSYWWTWNSFYILYFSLQYCELVEADFLTWQPSYVCADRRQTLLVFVTSVFLWFCRISSAEYLNVSCSYFGCGLAFLLYFFSSRFLFKLGLFFYLLIMNFSIFTIICFLLLHWKELVLSDFSKFSSRHLYT